MDILRLLPGTHGFPSQLAEIPDPPKALYVRGCLPPPGKPALAIVGTRRATPAGKALAREFARALAGRSFSIISGLAFGIDAAAHEGALEAGGHTIAVLPCGLDHVYPRSNVRLAEQILKSGGALVSEYPPGTEPLPYRFLERNRLVSGLARGVLVIEAPERSGALVTARLAAEQGRDCFIVPGPVGHPNYVGSHELIRKGAELVAKVDHILEAYGMLEEAGNGAAMYREIENLSVEEKMIFDAVQKSQGPLEVDKLIEASKLQPQAVNIAISFLLMKGVIKETPGGYLKA
jgi:DNA processing protein